MGRWGEGLKDPGFIHEMVGLCLNLEALKYMWEPPNDGVGVSNCFWPRVGAQLLISVKSLSPAPE